MRYMLMMHAPLGTGEYQITEWKPEELQAHIASCIRSTKSSPLPVSW